MSYLDKGAHVIGERIRIARKSQGLTMQQVAGLANMSVATLSRIETSKQALELGVFLLLVKILGREPADFLEKDGTAEPGMDPLIHRVASLAHTDRMKLWTELASKVRARRPSERVQTSQLALEVEELLAQIDFLHAEIESVSRRLRTRP